MLQSGIETTTTTSGTGTFDLSAPTDPLRVGFVSGIGSGGSVFYRCEFQSAGQWEEGYGTVTAGSPETLTRNVVRSSNSNALVNFSAGTKRIYCSMSSEGARFGMVGAVPVATGTANAIAIAHTPPMRVLRPGMSGRFVAGSSSNTGDVTLAIDSLSALTLRRADGTQIGPGFIRAGSVINWYAHTATEIRLNEPISAIERLSEVVISGTPTYAEFVLPPGFNTFKFDVAGVSPTAAAVFGFHLSVDGGSSWLTSGTEYGVGYMFNRTPGFDVATTASFASISTAISSTGFMRSTVELTPAPGGSAPSSFTSTGAGLSNTGPAHEIWTYGGVSTQTATRPNRIRFFANATTFRNFGRITQMGIR